MTLPRWAIPGTRRITRRVDRGEFLLRPDASVNGIFLYALAFAAAKHEVDVLACTVMSNHVHVDIYDPTGDRTSRFMECFFFLTARAMNRYLERKGPLWDSNPPSVVHVNPSAEDLVSGLGYSITNAVRGELVTRAKDWPGVCVHGAQTGDRKILAKRPGVYFSSHGDMPEEVELELKLPPCLDANERSLRRKIQNECRRIESTKQQELKAARRRVAGRRRILKVSRLRRAKSPAKSRENFHPHVACKSRPQRLVILECLKEFRARYRAAWQSYKQAAASVVFPGGTLKMVHQFGCHALPSEPPPQIA